MTDRTILKLEIILHEDDCCPGEHAPYPRPPEYRMEYAEEDQVLVEAHLWRLAAGFSQNGNPTGNVGYIERVKP